MTYDQSPFKSILKLNNNITVKTKKIFISILLKFLPLNLYIYIKLLNYAVILKL
jgi:hypothetical protein